MIAWRLIVAAGLLTGAVVAASARAGRWRTSLATVAAVAVCGLIIAWRAMSNAARLNTDFVSRISVGDTGCLCAGALGPAAVALLGKTPYHGRWPLPAVVGGVAGFMVNVVIL